MNIVTPLITGLVLVAALFYLYGIIRASYVSISGNGAMDDFLANVVTVIGGVLATNLGAVLGYDISGGSKDISLMFDSTTAGNFRAAAAYFYVFCLIIAIVCWFIAKQKQSTTIVPLLPELSKTLLGVIVGALTVALGNNGG